VCVVVRILKIRRMVRVLWVGERGRHVSTIGW